jgi:Spy/CpxP family protein refolding chaperone
MNKTFLAALVSVLLILPVASAQPWGNGKMADKLNLTDQQMEQMQNLKMQAQKQLIPRNADLKLAQLELKEIMMKSKVDEKAAQAQIDKISAIKTSIAKLKMQNMLAMRKVLTDEQLNNWMQMRHEKGFREHRAKGVRGMRGKMGCMMGSPGMGPGCGMGHEMKIEVEKKEISPEMK